MLRESQLESGSVDLVQPNLLEKLIHLSVRLNKMVYVCQNCSHEIKEEQVRGRVICPYCSSRILFKSRGVAGSTVKAR